MYLIYTVSLYDRAQVTITTDDQNLSRSQASLTREDLLESITPVTNKHEHSSYFAAGALEDRRGNRKQFTSSPARPSEVQANANEGFDTRKARFNGRHDEAMQTQHRVARRQGGCDILRVSATRKAGQLVRPFLGKVQIGHGVPAL